ncbi:aminotransferase DegT [Bacteroidetes bacterium UKL13-3]|nr:aminotransferase DegT [Bacteroidetes bacterium UKL13-3]HCP94700.1 aminotransferase DegT [Bacteroidota bacterium]
MIPVTKPFLPPIEEYQQLLADIWQRQWLTNNGPLVNELELKLKDYLGLPHVLYVNNGTIALQIAIKALGLTGEIITTPFSYVATTSSIVWEGCKPVFVDIHPETFNIDPQKIEAAITPNTSAILATHVYGNPCDIEAIDRTAKKHNLKVIYDAAHCFGTTYKGKSVFAYGDISTTSFHATKIFHTVEGGALFSNDPELIKKMAFMRNFGHAGPEEFAEVGINGKNSEFHAAMGIVNLKYMAPIFEKRKAQCLHYQQWLKHPQIKFLTLTKEANYNYAYMPIMVESEELAVSIITILERSLISPRRYFYPALNTVSLYKSHPTPNCESIAKRIICLPLYHSLTNTEIDMICRIILRTLNN